jgi:hypothetical protein
MFNYEQLTWTTGTSAQGDPVTGLGGRAALVNTHIYQVATRKIIVGPNPINGFSHCPFQSLRMAIDLLSMENIERKIGLFQVSKVQLIYYCYD